jgi:pimeloyl-ACP methyl ester carboxylesterase
MRVLPWRASRVTYHACETTIGPDGRSWAKLAPMAQTQVNGVELHYEERGAGVPIVFSHGLLWSGRMFEAQVEALAGRYRCITYDHRGQGQSPRSPTLPYSIDQLADDAAALIESLGAAPCHFVGLSMGGFVGMRLALYKPELLRSLTLIESAGDCEPRLNIPKYRAMSLVAQLVGVGVLLRPVMRIMFGSAFLRDSQRAGLRARQEAQLRGIDVPGMIAALDSVIMRRPLISELPRIKTRTLILHGEDDRAIVPARARATAAAIPHARLQMIPRAGHTSSVEEPAEVTRALAQFLDEAG